MGVLVWGVGVEMEEGRRCERGRIIRVRRAAIFDLLVAWSVGLIEAIGRSKDGDWTGRGRLSDYIGWYVRVILEPRD
jgi:hypothetical protein